MAIIICSSVFGQEFELNGIAYEITSYSAPYTVKVRSKSPAYSGDIIIPSTVDYNSKTYTVTKIGNHSFGNCTGLTSIVIPNTVTGIEDHGLARCSSLTSLTIPNSVTYIGEWAFEHCSGLTSITIPNSVTSIGREAFQHCTNLTTVNLSSSLVSISDGLFQDCGKISSIVLPNSITSLGSWSFSNCSSLSSVNFSNSITTIGDFVFDNCNNLSSIVLPASLRTIGNFAFNCRGLSLIVSYATTPPTGNGFFFDVNKSIPLYVPEASITDYRNANDWKDFTNIYSTVDIEGQQILAYDEAVNIYEPVVVQIASTEIALADNIISYQFDVNYDPTILSYDDCNVLGTLSEVGTIEINSSIPGQLSISFMNSSPIFGLGNLLELNFNTLIAGSSPITLSNVYYNVTDILNITNGVVDVIDPPPTVAISYSDSDIRYLDELLITATANEPIDIANPMHLNMSGAVTLADAVMTRLGETEYTYLYTVPEAIGNVNVTITNATDLVGNSIVSTPTSGGSFTIIEYIPGDVDGNGRIMAYDAAISLQYSVGLDPISSVDPLPWENWRTLAADVDETGTVTANDAGMILQYSAGIITRFDASSKKSTTFGDVTIEVEDDEIVFYSRGSLIGLNLSTSNENNILEDPVIVAENFLSAKNIDGTTYNIGICTATAANEGEALIKIPFNTRGQFIFDLVVNGVEKSVRVDLATGLGGFDSESISVYPNPVTSMLCIEGLHKRTTARIYNINGQLMLTDDIYPQKGTINVTKLPAGLYIMKMKVAENEIVKRFSKE